MTTFAETELLLKTAITLSDNSIKDIANASNIKPNTLYKWKTTDVHLSPEKADVLLIYFKENEPQVLVAAALLRYVLKLLCLYLASYSE